MLRSVITNGRIADLIFYSNGQIRISSRISKILSLEATDVIDFLYQDNEDQYYIYVKQRQFFGNHKGKVYRIKKGGKAMQTSVREVTNLILNLTNKDNEKKVKLPCGEPINNNVYGTIIPIITKTPL